MTRRIRWPVEIRRGDPDAQHATAIITVRGLRYMVCYRLAALDKSQAFGEDYVRQDWRDIPQTFSRVSN